MKNIFIKAAVIACLLGSVGAGATSFDGSSVTDTKGITLTGTQNALDFGYSWTDLQFLTDYYNTKSNKFTYTLTGGATKVTGSFADGTPTTGGATIRISGLTAGTYTLALTGDWTDFHDGGNPKDTFKLGVVSINSVTAVPEPESYAMLLAGLGLIGTIAVRRRPKEHA